MQVLILAIALCCATTFATPHRKVNHEFPVAANADAKAEIITCNAPGQKIPDPYDCTAFYLCAADFTPMHSYCPTGESFSHYALQCIPYDATQCANVITAPPVTTVNPVACSYTSQVIPHPYDCAAYYVCGMGLAPIFYYCGTNLYYDPAYASCNIISRVSCSSGYRPSPIPTAHPAPSGVGPLPVCSRPADIYANYYDCSYFWKCSQTNTPEAFKCPPDLHFDHISSTCNYISLANCIVREAEEK